jgi:hypothetical protein
VLLEVIGRANWLRVVNFELLGVGSFFRDSDEVRKVFAGKTTFLMIFRYVFSLLVLLCLGIFGSNGVLFHDISAVVFVLTLF